MSNQIIDQVKEELKKAINEYGYFIPYYVLEELIEKIEKQKV